jgi:5-methylcytosine-specific restriction protein A
MAVRDDGQIIGHGPLCCICAYAGRITAATEVDHLDGNSRNNDGMNLRSLCHSCHSARTARDQAFGRRLA